MNGSSLITKLSIIDNNINLKANINNQTFYNSTVVDPIFVDPIIQTNNISSLYFRNQTNTSDWRFEMMQGEPEKFQLVHACITRGSNVALAFDFEENMYVMSSLFVGGRITARSTCNLQDVNCNSYIRITGTSFSALEFKNITNSTDWRVENDMVADVLKIMHVKPGYVVQALKISSTEDIETSGKLVVGNNLYVSAKTYLNGISSVVVDNNSTFLSNLSANTIDTKGIGIGTGSIVDMF